MIQKEDNHTDSLTNNLTRAGRVIIFSAPSGSGKTTIVKYLLKHSTQFDFSISACTRSKRSHEVHGKDYYFLKPEEFEESIQKNAFVEWEEVYDGLYYGTLKEEIQRIWNNNKNVLFDVDVKGGLKLKEYFKEQALGIFIAPPSLAILEERLRKRNTDAEESIQRRLKKAKEELNFRNAFDALVVNEVLDETLLQVQKLITDFLEE